MIIIHQIKLSAGSTQNRKQEQKRLAAKTAEILKISPEALLSFEIDRKSLDARKKPDLYDVYTVICSVKKEEQVLKHCKNRNVSHYEKKPYHFSVTGTEKLKERPVIAGMGPAGLFCGYFLAKYGYRPVIYERGKRVEERTEDVENFWKTGKLLLSSNVQFGEGGAGTFSDGKLNTLVRDPAGRNKEVLKIFVECGAPEEILYESKPHIGTDILKTVVSTMRNRMLSMGAEIHYESQVTDFIIKDGRLTGITVNNGKPQDVSVLILATGHSSRDTFKTLYERKVPMAAKSFAVGFRVQHPQNLIDENQYGTGHSNLPAASYKLTAKTENGRSVYSFCMCPGGYVVNSSSEEGGTVVNGMSYSGRNSGTANSAVIVSVTPEDFDSEACEEEEVSPLKAIAFQRELEKRAYEAGNGAIPVQYFGDFCQNKKSSEQQTENFNPRIKGSYVYSNLRNILPEECNRSFIEGMHLFGRRIAEFDSENCLLAGVESRTSSPIRIHRNTECESSITGLYPCGEGAGYAGGITSAAMDGMIVAESIAKKYIP